MQQSTVGAVILALSFCASAKTYAPLPKEIIAAKRLCIVNQTSNPKYLDTAYEQFKSWGRYEISEDAAKCDLVVAISGVKTGESTSNIVMGNTVSTTNASVVGYGNYATGTATTTTTHPVVIPFTTVTGLILLRVVNHKADAKPTIWSTSVPWDSIINPVKRCFNELQKRVDSQDREEAKANQNGPSIRRSGEKVPR